MILFTNSIRPKTMPNYHPKTEHLPKQKTTWNNLPTEVARVPLIFLEEIKAYARSLDGQCSPFEAIISALDKLNPDELEQIKLAIESLSGKELETVSTVAVPEEVQLSDSEIAAYTAKFGFVPSKYQIAIIDWILQGKGNACCNAVAGAGKSSSLFIVGKTLEQQGIKPYEVKVCVFGKENSKDLIKKFGAGWQSSISTLHSAGWSLVKQELGIRDSRSANVSSKKYRAIATSFDLVPGNSSRMSLLTQNKIVEEADVFFKLIDLVRLYNTEAHPLELERLCDHHEIEGLLKPYECAQQIQRCLLVGEQQAANKVCFDFTDQLWLPVKWELNKRSWFKSYKFVLVDECQDLNAVQLELVCMLAGKQGRILAVGDPRQAIMGFAGADCDSYEAIARRINAIELPLSICYRCPSSHITLVKERFLDIPIEVAKNAKLGNIQQINKNEVLDYIQNKDMILSRKTAPLVTLCLKLITNKKNAQIKGRAIGDNLKVEMKAIEKDFYFKWDNFNDSLDSYTDNKVATYKGLDNEEQLIENFKDKMNAIRAIYQATPHARSMDNLITEIDSIFSDDNAPITLSTCHRAKGLEAERIFIYEPQHMPMEWKKQQAWQYKQEKNLLYVALTRSKSELFIVGECDWYKPDKSKNQLTKNNNSTESKQSDDYFSLCRQAREKLDEELTPIFKNPDSRAKFIRTVIDDDIDLGILEDSGKIKYTSEENKKAVYTAIDTYWEKFYAASRKEEEEEEKRPSYRYAWTGEDDDDDF
jgi:DNA helicase II / ATP-dependent DNA helicase PcrA